MFGWGDLSEADYRRQVQEVRAQLAAIPSPDHKLVVFDDYRQRAAEMRSFAEMVDSASGDKLQELVPWLIARVETADKHVVRIVPTDPARHFFAWAEQEPEQADCAGVAPRTGSGPWRWRRTTCFGTPRRCDGRTGGRSRTQLPAPWHPTGGRSVPGTHRRCPAASSSRVLHPGGPISGAG